jgi:predicted AAA+ superfamily ATPase
MDRDALGMAQEALGQYPVVTLVGPRQAGKTTLARALGARPYANLEEPETRRFAQDDARGFLAQFPDGAVLDEIQRVPELLSWIQVDVDRSGTPGRWILTGSHQPALRGAIAQSLAGRTAMLRLLPLSLGELAAAGRPLVLDQALIDGGFPRLHVAGIPAARFHGDYLATYVERDVRQIAALRDLDAFQRYLGLLAGRLGAPVNWSGLGADAGVSEITAKAWAGVLEASFVAAPLRPWFASIGKRLKKHPKFYWCDTGLAAHLLGITDPAHLARHPLRGGLFENLIVSEAMKAVAHWGAAARLHLFATASHEVDLLVEAGGATLAIEIKSGRTIAGDWFAGLAAAAAIPALGVDGRLVVYGGDQEQVGSEVTVCPWWAFPAHLARWLIAHRAAPGAPDPDALRERLRAAAPVP